MAEEVSAIVTKNSEVRDVGDDDVLIRYTRSEYESRKKFGMSHFEQEKKDRLSYLSAVSDGGNYVWNYFIPLEANFDKIINSTVTRLVYLATFINSSNYVAHENGKPMDRKQVQELLKLDDSTFKRFLRDAKENDYLVEDDVGFKLLPTKFGKGTIQKSDDQVAAKLFVYSVQFLYENATVASHKWLAYLYMIIPYVNLHYNVLCENPWESDKTKVCKMSVETLCEKLGLDPTHSSRFVNQLLKIEFPDRFGDTRSILVSVKGAKNSKIREFLCVNPALYSVYANKEKLMELTGLRDVFMLEEGKY